MASSRGSVVTSRWSPLRREVERILADGAWHEEQMLFAQVARFVDPPLAARHWVRTSERNTKRWDIERESGSAVFRYREAHAIAVGRRGVFQADLRCWESRGRIERGEWNGRRRVRLKP